MRFYVRTPDARVLPHEAPSMEWLKAVLLPGYEIVKSPLAVMLDEHGEELLAWLAERGIKA
jgi:hypothetical protein